MLLPKMRLRDGSRAVAEGSEASACTPWRLHRTLALYVLGLLGFLLLMTWAEAQGLSRHWIGPIFLFLTVMVYAAIGVYGRTSDPEEYYVAGRRIPPMYNGMAAAADWMSAASFISLRRWRRLPARSPMWWRKSTALA